ncbi:coat protein [Erysiphe necator associated tombus-like virus 8]|nr:coat protein [Erysiphe necator associated tombus-like virus 8]
MTNQKNNKKSTKVVYNHFYKNCRDAVTVPTTGSSPGTTTAAMTQGASGAVGNFATSLSPVGLTSVVYGTSTVTAGAIGNVAAPVLRGLYNKAVDFQWYRVTSARLVFVGTVPATINGQITLYSYVDPMDAANRTSAAYLAGPNTRTFDLSNAATKELSVPMAIDSSWKKVTSILTVPGNYYPFYAASAASVANVNTISDLCFGAIGATWGSTAAQDTPLGVLNVVYDVEFKGPIDTAINQ